MRATKQKKDIEAVYPLSPMQQGMLFHYVYNPESATYFEQFFAKLRGDLDISLFERAWNTVVQRHSALRTSFVWKKLERMLQVVHRRVDVPVNVLDWRHVPVEDREAELETWAEQDRRRAFNLAKPPLMRLHLFRLEDDLYQFVWSFHHLLADGWSMPIILREVFTVYETLRAGLPIQLPPVRPYRDYINWLQKQDLGRAEAYWKELLLDLAPEPLPILSSGRAETGPKRAKEETKLDAAVSSRLVELARTNQVTVNAFVQAAWSLLLARYLGSDDVVFGATVSGRPPELRGVEQMVGLFINTLPVRARLDEKQTVRELVKALQRQILSTQEVQYTPLVEIQRWVGLPRDMQLFDTIVVFENYPVSAALGNGKASVEVLDVRSFEKSNYPVSLMAALAGRELGLKVAYDPERLDREAAQRMLRHLTRLLANFAEQPELPLAEVDLLDDTERHQVLVEWNQREVELPAAETVHGLFEETVRRWPKRVAVEFGGKSLSFEELDKRANQLAHFLLARGLKREELVGVGMSRSLEMLVAVLGVLKAGGAYVPLDVKNPPERLAHILDDTRMRWVLTLQHDAAVFAQLPVEAVLLDGGWSEIANLQPEAPRVRVDSRNACYVIYTSGSTGKPKGVVVEHHSVLNLAANLKQDVYARFADRAVRVSMNAPLYFDASMQRMLGMMMGHTLVIVPEELRTDGRALVEFYRDQRIDSADGVPAQLKLMLEEGLLEDGQRKPAVFLTGGEALDAETWERIRSQTEIQFFNMYGPTECTVDASITPVTREAERPSIGRALANSRFYVLDSKMRPVPIGVPGVLFVSGANLARGYLSRPDLTAAAFVPDPFSSEPGSRMYRTGDLVRWTKAGQVEFLGRVDDQVKVRGFRIELGEIESVLGQHPDVREAVVVLREHQATGKFLAAYVVPASGSLNKEALKNYLRERLPDYMVPRVFVQLERLPRTSSGKVNRRVLPLPSEEDLGGAERSAPRTPVQELLASIWSDVLKVRDVGPEDDFFALGGHSLLATRLASRIRDAFGVELPLRDIFEAPSLAEMARRIEARRSEGEALKQPPLKRVARDRDLPLSFAQHRLWFLDQLAPGSTNYNVPSAFRLKGVLDVSVLRKALKRIVERHEILRTSFANRGGDPVQVIHERVDVSVPFVDLSGLPEQDRLPVARLLMRDDALRPFDLGQAPLFRVLLIRLHENDHLVLLNMHHTITDGWSMGILVDELATIYNSLKEGHEPELPELPIQYADYAVWQREWLQGEVLERQVAFWKGVVGENPPVLELPTDRPRPAVQTFRGNSLRQDLDAELAESLRDLSQKQGVTLFMTLLAGFDTLLHRYTGQNQILVGSPIANRTRTETERLIGYFANTIVFGADFSEVEDFRSLLRQVRENTLQAYAHQDLPFEKLVEAVQPERDLSHSPIFQVAFVFQNTPFEKRALKDLVIEGFPPENPIAKYDLTLYATETDSGILCFWEYNTDLFDQSTVERMMRHYANLLRAVAKDPKQKISELDFLAEDEKHRLLVEWNETAVPLPEEPTVPRVFSEVVLKQPDAPAVQHHDVVLSYRELDVQSSRLADLLLAKGLRTDEIVGISLPRSVDVAVAMLGILKAGGAFLPIDPTYPEDRVRYMLHDSGTRFLVTTSAVSEKLPLGRTEAVLMEELETSRVSNGQLPVAVSPDNLAYVIYTSGSTGRPKGTMLPHRGLVNLARAQRKAFAIHPGSRILQFASLSFDASVWETVMALLNGATLVYADQAELLTGDGVGEVLRREQITTVTLPPSVLAVVPQGEFPHLRTIVTAGERCTLDLVKRWAAGRQFVNAYGPTETTVCASMYEASERDRREPPIGRPIDNFQLYVLDSNWQLSPVGVPGELCVGGVGLARGYLNRPDLTAEKFIPNPFTSSPGERLYRTGDLVRWLSDGNLEFLGRIDTQVKLRGFRIELGEIEAVLAGHPAVADVAVIVREDIKGQPYLAAYYVSEAGQEPPASEFRSYLRKKLPEYMVPTVYVRLDALPLTPNGKVDRRRLPKPELSRGGLSTEYTAPRTEVERELCGIVEELLGLDRVGVHDNFFELGGHSLLATKFMSRIRERLGVELPLRDLFEKPTVAELAVAIEERQRAEGEDEDRIERLEREPEDIEALLREIEQLSDEEAEVLLRQGLTEGGNQESGL